MACSRGARRGRSSGRCCPLCQQEDARGGAKVPSDRPLPQRGRRAPALHRARDRGASGAHPRQRHPDPGFHHQRSRGSPLRTLSGDRVRSARLWLQHATAPAMDAQSPCDPVPGGAPATRRGPGHRARAFVGHHGRGVSPLQAPPLVHGLVLLSGYYFPTARLDVAQNLALAIPGIGDAIATPSLRCWPG